MAVRDGALRDGGLGQDAVLLHELRCGAHVGVDPLHRGGVVRKELRDGLWMLLRIGAAHDHAAHGEHHVRLAIRTGGVLKERRHIERSAQAVILHERTGDVRLRQHADFRAACGEQRRQLAVLRDILDGHAVRKAVLLEDVAQHVLRHGALTGRVDCASRQILNGLDAFIRCDYVQHAQRVEREQLHCAVCLLIERSGEVGRAGGDIRAAAGDGRDDVVGGAAQCERVFAPVILHHADHADAGRSGQRVDAHGLLAGHRNGHQQEEKTEQGGQGAFHRVYPLVHTDLPSVYHNSPGLATGQRAAPDVLRFFPQK